MLYGESLSDAEAFGQMSLASDRGVTTFDSAEMYPVPQREETQGLSEQLLGRWLKSAGRRRCAAQDMSAPPQSRWAGYKPKSSKM
jgi:aryl-alcohol dehydrogenase-like predicted oxidoreductase